MNYEQANNVKHLAPEVYDTLLKLGWKGWQPQVGEFCLWGQAVLLITDINDYRLEVSGVEIVEEINVNQAIPILEWEEIVRIVEKATKYSFEVIIPTRRAPKQKAECVILEPHIRKGIKLYKPMVDERADFPQEAVMLAVIALGKELK